MDPVCDTGLPVLTKMCQFNTFHKFQDSKNQLILVFLSHRSPSNSPVLPLILPTHLDPIPRPLSPFPEPRSPLSYQARMTDTTILRAVILFPRAKPTNHAISMLVWMLLCLIMAPVTRIHLRATGEPEPAIGLRIVLAAATSGQLCASR